MKKLVKQPTKMEVYLAALPENAGFAARSTGSASAFTFFVCRQPFPLFRDYRSVLLLEGIVSRVSIRRELAFLTGSGRYTGTV